MAHHLNKQINFLEMVPVLRDGCRVVHENGAANLAIPRTSLLERIAIKWFKQAKEHHYRLDALGECVLKHCDGNYRVSEISAKLTETFGEAAEPVVPRLLKFLQELDAHDLVTLHIK